MKVPTDATKVFQPVARTGTGSAITVTTTLNATDTSLTMLRDGGNYNPFCARLIGSGKYLTPNDTVAEISNSTVIQFDASDSVKWPAGSSFTGSGNYADTNYANYFFARRPNFHDVVCYTGTGSARTVAHNLTVVPELMIVKSRSFSSNWQVYSAATTATKYLELNTTSSATTVSTRWNDTAPTSSVFTVGTSGGVNNNGSTYVAYLFATCAGVSKVGSYTGNGGTQAIACGFTGGARFVLIKRTDSTGSWWVWDTARGMVAGTDPRLALNSTAAETNNNWVYTTSGGFQIVTSDATINASGGSYIFLAIA
jgi:hypothetical protein